MIQPESGPATIRDLRNSVDPGAFTMGRIFAATTTQGCNAWTILRITVDYYREMQARHPDGQYWTDRIKELLETEARWVAGKP